MQILLGTITKQVGLPYWGGPPFRLLGIECRSSGRRQPASHLLGRFAFSYLNQKNYHQLRCPVGSHLSLLEADPDTQIESGFFPYRNICFDP